MGEIIAAIVVALISGGCSIVAVVITSNTNQVKMQHQLELSQAVTDTKLEALTSEVREHNNFAKRMPVIEEQIKVINHRIEDLERKVE